MSNDRNAPVEYEGKITAIGEVTKVKEYQKFSVILDITQPDDKRQAMLAVEWFGKELPRWHGTIAVGKRVKLRGRASSREFNGKWYTTISVFSCYPLATSDNGDDAAPPFPPIPPAPPMDNEEEVPF